GVDGWLEPGARRVRRGTDDRSAEALADEVPGRHGQRADLVLDALGDEQLDGARGADRDGGEREDHDGDGDGCADSRRGVLPQQARGAQPTHRVSSRYSVSRAWRATRPA